MRIRLHNVFIGMMSGIVAVHVSHDLMTQVTAVVVLAILSTATEMIDDAFFTKRDRP